MRRLFGARTGIEAVFLIAVPIAALSAGLSAIGIIAASAIAYLLVLLFETGFARGITIPRVAPAIRMPAAPRRLPQRPRLPPERLRPAAPPATSGPEIAPDPEPWHAEPARAPQRWQPELEREPEPEAEPVPEPEPVPESVPEPEPPVLQAVPPPEPEPEPAPAERPAATVVPLPFGAEPRQWNLWDLERLTRESSGADPERDEERHFLLMYLREFADSNGLLPVEFDGLVRDSFGDLVGR